MCGMQVLQLMLISNASSMRGSVGGLQVTESLLYCLQSLEALLGNLREAGYDLGHGSGALNGEAIVRALQAQEDQRKIIQGARAMTIGCAPRMGKRQALRAALKGGV